MNHSTAEQYTAALMRTLSPLCPPDAKPRVSTDTNDKGNEITEFRILHPADPRFSVTLDIHTVRSMVHTCTLRFGAAEIAGALSPDDAIPAIEEILAGHIAAIVRYKTRDAYDNCRMAGSGQKQWLYQLPDDEEAFTGMLKKLRTPAGAWEKLSGKLTGVFEVFRWDGSELIER